MKPIIDRNEKGHLTHYRLSDGTERWYDYDADGNITHERLSNGDERWYDADGCVTKWMDKNGILECIKNQIEKRR